MRISETIPISAYSRLSNELGDRLCVLDARINAHESEIILEHVEALLAVPEGVLAKLVAHGLARVQIGKGGVASFPGYDAYRELQIPGAPRGVTWEQSRGAYLSSQKEIILGTGSHGYEGTAAHEVGHALGNLSGYESSEILAWEYRNQANGIFGRNTAFYTNRQLSATGRKEFYAETVSLGIMSPDALEANFSRSYVNFILKVTLAP